MGVSAPNADRLGVSAPNADRMGVRVGVSLFLRTCLGIIYNGPNIVYQPECNPALPFP